MTEKPEPYEGKAHIYDEGTGLRNLMERNNLEVVDIMTNVLAALERMSDDTSSM